MRVKIFVNKRWTASYKKAAFFSSDLRCLLVCAGGERVCSRDNFAPKTECLAWVQSSIVQLLSHCFASLSLHRILIDQGENDPLNIRQKNFTSKKYIFQNIFKNDYKTAITMISSPCSVLS